jgi:hypothetical protein
MARINQTSNLKAADLTAAFPKWSTAYVDPNSNANILLTPFANAMEYLENTANEINRDAKVLTCDPDKHPWRQWLFNKLDVLEFDVTVADSKENYISNINFIDGIIEDEFILIKKVDSEAEFYYPSIPTEWYVSGILSSPISGTINSCHMYNNQLTVVSSSGTSYDPGVIHSIQLPNRWLGNLSLSEDTLLIKTITDPNYSDITVSIIANDFGYRQLLEHQFKDKYDKVLVVDEFASIESGYTIYLTSGFTLLDTSNYNVRDISLIDLDNDGIVDTKELDLIDSVFGKRKADFTTQDWELKYKKYDINGDLVIDDRDKAIVAKFLNSVSRTATAIEFDNPGKYTVTYSMPNDSLAGTTAIIPIVSPVPSLEYFRNNINDYLNSIWTSGFVDATYDNDKRIYYYLDNISKSVWAYEIDRELGTVFDKIKLLLPMFKNIELRGRPKIIIMQTDQDSPEEFVYVQEINSGNRASGDVDIILRDRSGLTQYASGLTIIDDSKLVTFDEGNIKILLPLNDYYYSDNINVDGNTIHMREKYEELSISPSGQVSPIFQNIFNRFDFHGQDKGIRRLPGEDNVSFKKRILDVYQHFPSRDKRGIIYGIERELGLPVLDIAPDDLTIIPSIVTSGNAESMSIYYSGEVVPYDNINYETVYLYGKRSHDIVSYISSGTTLLSIDREIIL